MATERDVVVAGPLAHDLGPAGTVVINAESDDIRVRGVDGTSARVVSPAGGAGLETVAEPGRFTIGTGRAVRGIVFGFRVGGKGFGFHDVGTIEVEVPRDARVEVRSAAGDVAMRDVHGGARVKTASGDVSLKRAAGPISVSVASGDVLVEAVEAITFEARSVSGDVRARAPRLDLVSVETVSGDVHLAGALGSPAEHVVSTVSGDVELAVAGGLTGTLKTVSGEIDCTHPGPREGDGRRRPLVIGDGAARLAVRTMSGDLEIRELRPAGSDARTPLPPVAPAPPAPTALPAPSAPVAPPAPFAPPAPPSPPAGQLAGSAAASDATLATLEALARGEIDVAEAERRLAAGVPARSAGEGTDDA